MTFDIENVYNEIQKKNPIYAFKGTINKDLIEKGLCDIEKKIENSDKKIRRKVYYVAVESIQNLYHHSETPQSIRETEKIGEKFVMFSLLKNGSDIYEFTTGNFVDFKTMQFLKSRIEQLNFLSKDEIKILYKKILNNKEFSDKGGGGLGMIDILKKTGNKYDYKFIECGDNNYLYLLSITIT